MKKEKLKHFVFDHDYTYSSWLWSYDLLDISYSNMLVNSITFKILGVGFRIQWKGNKLKEMECLHKVTKCKSRKKNK